MVLNTLPNLFLSVLLIIVSSTLSLYGQKRANHWPFADYELNFTNKKVNVTRAYASRLNRGMGVISDENGNLVMYTDGYSVFNKDHQQMQNGSALMPSTNNTSTQESIIIPKPGSNNIFYIFSVDPWNGQTTSGLYYSIVDVSRNGGLGEVVTKGVRLIQNTSNKLSATLHENGRDVWVITHENNSNKYFVLQITEMGISSTIKEQRLGASHAYWGGQLKFSPDGRKVAVNYTDPVRGMTLFKFDKLSGLLTDVIDFSIDGLNVPIAVGLEFSSDATKLYGPGDYSVIQYDVSMWDYNKIRDSRYRVSGNILYNSLRQFQLAPDGKIYITKGGGGGGTQHLGVVENPNSRGSEVVVKENGLYLMGGDSFVNYTPNFIQNYFYKTSFKYEGHCQSTPISFVITNEYHVDSVLWSFGEGSTSKLRKPQFNYTSPGKYKVTLFSYYSGIADTVQQELTIDPFTKFNLGNDTSVCRNSKFLVKEKFASYRWNTGDTTQFIRIQKQGRLKLTATNALGCAFKDSVLITVKELPVVNLSDTVQMRDLKTVELVPGSFASYSWSTGKTTPTISISAEGWYSVEVKDAFGCAAAKSTFVKSDVPQIFTSAPKWFRLNPLPSGSAGTDIYFLDEQIGFIVNGKELLRSKDKGNSWTIQMKATNGRRISFKGSIGYIVGDNGTVFKSTHGGDGWNKLTFPSIDALNAVTVIHSDTLLITSDNKLFTSNDGGQSWKVSSISSVDIEDSYFTTSKIGHIACKNGKILKTTDGGLTWRTILSTNSIPSNFFRIKFVNNLIGYASREHSEIYKTVDGGESWNRTQYSPDAAYGMQFLNEKVGFIAGQHGAISKTIDGGQTWSWAGFDGRKYGNDLYSIFFVDENQGYASGLGGRIIRTYDGGKTWNEYAATYSAIKQLRFTSQNVGYFLTSNVLYKTIDKGKNWLKLGGPLPTQKTIAFDFVNDNTGFAIVGGDPSTSANSGMVYVTTNGGVSWTKAHTNYQLSSEDLRCISFINESTGFVSGGFNFRTVLKTSDGGKNWSPVFTKNFGQIQFLNKNTGYARDVGYSYNRIYKTVDGGNNWGVIFEIEQEINSLYFLNESIGFFVGNSGLMYKTIDGGLNWEKLTPPYLYFKDVKFRNEKFGYIVDDYGQVYLTMDGGLSWTNDLQGSGILGLDFFGDDAYAYGNFGSILRSNIGFNAEVSLQPLSLENLTSSTAQVRTSIYSSLNLVSTPLMAEIRKQGTVYGNPIEIKRLNGFVNESLIYEFKNLEPEVIYFCRLKVVANTNSSSTTEFSFKTPGTITGLEADSEDIRIYPNPIHDYIIIELKNEYAEMVFAYTIVNLLGQAVAEGFLTGQQSIEVSKLNSGLYIINITNSKKTFSQRLVKE